VARVDIPATVGRLWQNSIPDVASQPHAQDALRESILRELKDDYRDVLDNEKEFDRGMIERREALRKDLAGFAAPGDGFSLAPRISFKPREAIERAVQVLYSGPHWRRAARNRIEEIFQEKQIDITNVTMGHTHWADEYDFRNSQGHDCRYVNSGSWRREAADFVVIEDGRMTLHRRKWTDPLPALR